MVHVAAAAIADGAPAFSFKLSSNLAHRLEIVRGTGRNLPVWVVQFERDVETVAVVVENEKSRRIAVDAAFQENPNWFVVGSHSIVPADAQTKGLSGRDQSSRRFRPTPSIHGGFG